MKNKKKLVYFLVASAIIVSSSAFAGQTYAINVARDKFQGVFGRVASISGSTLTLTDRKGVLYTVNATNAKIVGDIKVNDEVSVQGVINAVGIVTA